MVGYPPTLIASYKLTEKLREDMALANAQNVDPDAVTLARTLIETGQIGRMKAGRSQGNGPKVTYHAGPPDFPKSQPTRCTRKSE